MLGDWLSKGDLKLMDGDAVGMSLCFNDAVGKTVGIELVELPDKDS
jgi:hypothetical protein